MMRLNGRCFVVAVATCGLLWLALALLYTRMEGWDASSSPVDRQTGIAARVQYLEKAVKEELKESAMLLRELRDGIKTKPRASQAAHGAKSQDKKYARKGRLVLPVLVMACNRVSVRRCLDKLVRYRPSIRTFPIIVSQDCDHKPTFDVIQSYVSPKSGVRHLRHRNETEIVLEQKQKKFYGYYRISRHYKFALTTVLDIMKYDAVIIVEDDLDISEDFFEYFLGTYPLLEVDPTLWCISAWNDNGKKGLIDLSQPELLHRTDFFPGLGWLLPAKHWRRFKHNWPPAFFDDWLREPEQSGGYSCIRPEVSRTSTFGKEGVSKGLFFDMHLRFITLNEEFVPFTRLDLSYLLKDEYDRRLSDSIMAATPMTADELKRDARPDVPPARVTYTDKNSFKRIAKSLGLMDDFRSGVARTVYNGVVTCFYKQRRVYIAPAAPFVKYDRSWS